MSTFFFDKLPAAYEWPNQGGYSYYLPELTESGSQSNRVYVALYVYDSKPGKVRIYLHSRAVSAAGDGFRRLEDNIGSRMNRHRDGACEIWVNSQDDWINLKTHFEELCSAIESGWKKKREQQSVEEFEATESISTFEEETET